MDDVASREIAAFDTAPPPAAVETLRPACASPAWRNAILAGRPYGTLAQLVAASDAVITDLPWSEVEAALAAHPRIGERAAGTDRESTWSRQEQSGAAEADAERLRAGNVAYEERFGHVFLLCATGRSGDQMLAALTERLTHDAPQEQVVVRRELAAIVALRLAKALT
jgi:2-oxo-4-hydroxy-4-carboxy-5-ureidoimidazoline decarboxylase